MTWFEASRESQAVVRASPERIWAILTDPGLVAEMTPFVRAITEDGDHWRWDLATIPGLGVSIAPSFTVRMEFDEPRRIGFRHDPPDGERERAGADGTYVLEEVETGTRLSIDLATKVDLPLARLASPAVSATMRAVLAEMGRRFSSNLLEHLDTTADELPEDLREG
ncbi:CoxG family protein [Aeromicrobium sp. CF4.19]|uniref:CoxG family protein n=1 Tax=Aeromicrobium sp. CF4.19 TaxID=3373082 RepID=UPI003EE58351